MRSLRQLLSALARPARAIVASSEHRPARRRWLATSAALLLALGTATFQPSADAWDGGRDRGHGRDHDDAWIGTWSASPQSAPAPLPLNGQTVRNIVHVSIGGDRVRVHLTNAFGTDGLVIGAAHVALRKNASAIHPGSDRTLTFGGAPTITIPPGAVVVSDPVSLHVPDLGDLAVSVYSPSNLALKTEHSLGVQTTYVSSSGDFTGAANFAAATTTLSSYFVSGVEVKASERSSAIVTLGDSITDGYASTADTNRRWPNRLAARLDAQRGPYRIAVLNAGISGNRVLHDSPIFGINALARLDRDVLVQSGARWVIVLEGINDIGQPGSSNTPSEEVTAAQIIQGHRQIIDRVHAMGLKVYGATLTPYEGTIFPGYYSSAGEVKRQAVNQWIRTSHAYDAVIDFDAAVRDPAHPSRIRLAYDSGDHLHPNDAGYQAMADAIHLSLFDDDD